MKRTGEGWSRWYRGTLEGIVTSTSNGVIDSVLAKLNELMMGDMCSNLLGVSSMGIQFLWNELSAMKALLEKLEDADELDLQAKDWRDQVREMTFDIEDCIDEFTSNEECDDAKAGFINKVSSFLKTLRSRVKTACQIKDLKNRLQEIDERHKRYKIEEHPSSSTRRIDPRLSVLYNEETSLVGLANPKEELLEVMSKGKQFMVVALVGFGGLGKTTLVNEVYRQVSRQFNSKAFVSISQNPDMARVLKCILSQLEPRPYFDACEVQDLINDLREHLHDTRIAERVAWLVLALTAVILSIFGSLTGFIFLPLLLPVVLAPLWLLRPPRLSLSGIIGWVICVALVCPLWFVVVS